MNQHIETLEEMFALAANERRMKEADACAAAIALMRAPVGATGKLNGYMFREKAIEILMDSEIPMWMTNTPGIRVTVTAMQQTTKEGGE